MNQNVTKAQDKPLLDAESFQSLLAAAFVLQSSNDVRPPGTIYGGPPCTFVAEGIVQKRTPSLRGEPRLQAAQSDVLPLISLNRRTNQPNMSASQEMTPVPAGASIVNQIARARWAIVRRPVVREGTVPEKPPLHRGRMITRGRPTTPMVWRTVEALAIATVFCMMMGVSIRRASLSRNGPSLPSVMAEPRTAQRKTPPAAEILALSRQRVVTLNSRQLTDGGKVDVLAEDIRIHYQTRAGALQVDNPAAKKLSRSSVQAQRLHAEDTTLQQGVRLTLGGEGDMLAADTVVRYNTGSTASRVQDQRKEALSPPGYK